MCTINLRCDYCARLTTASSFHWQDKGEGLNTAVFDVGHDSIATKILVYHLGPRATTVSRIMTGDPQPLERRAEHGRKIFDSNPDSGKKQATAVAKLEYINYQQQQPV